jgi:hypothetical protein
VDDLDGSFDSTMIHREYDVAADNIDEINVKDI